MHMVHGISQCRQNVRRVFDHPTIGVSGLSDQSIVGRRCDIRTHVVHGIDLFEKSLYSAIGLVIENDREKWCMIEVGRPQCRDRAAAVYPP